MKIDKKVRDKLEKGLVAWRNMFVKKIDSHIRRIEKVRLKSPAGVERIMAEKRRLLGFIAGAMPLKDTTCYFCFLNNYGGTPGNVVCKECRYGEIHGICGDRGSTYQDILDAQTALENAILGYEHGEDYDEEETE